MDLACSNFMLTNKLSLPISTSKSYSQRAVKIICGKPPRPSGSKGRSPQINNVLAVADKKKMTPMETNAAAVNSFKRKVEEDNKNTDAHDFVPNSTAQTTQAND